jgi:site-specific recombinase XerD
MARKVRSPGWVELFLDGDVPALVEAVPAPFLETLRGYLSDLRTKQKRAPNTIDIHGRSLIDFLVWLGSHAQNASVDTILSDHIALYLTDYRADGRVQGRKSKREGHRKTVRTMSSKADILRTFFAWAKLNRLCQANPVDGMEIDWGPREVHPLPEPEVAELLRAWTNPSTDPRTAVVGLLCLLYGLSTGQIRTLPVSAVDLTAGTFYGLEVPAPLPDWLRPVLDRYLRWRQDVLGGVQSERLVVTRSLNVTPVHLCLFVQLLKPYGVSVRQLRSTALAQTLQHGHLKLLTVFGLTNEGMRRYQDLARLAQNTRKVEAKPNLW